jgi:hypothetical protein
MRLPIYQYQSFTEILDFSFHEKFDERLVNVVVISASAMFVKHSTFRQLIEILGRSGARHVQLLLDEFDPGIWMSEKVIQKVLRI